MKERTLFIAIIGLPNVGKSTLFNRICGEMKAVVEDLPGVTRDRNYARVERFSIPFVLVDTGGFARESEDPLQKQVLEQTMLAIEEADIVFALFDGNAGVRPGDEEVVARLRGSGKQVYYLVNKVDGMEQEGKIAEFYALGIPEILPVSALRGHHVSAYMERALSEWPRYAQYKAAWKDHVESIAQTKRELLSELEIAAAQFIPEEDDDEEEIEDDDTGETQEEVDFPPVFVPGDGDEQSLKQYEAQWRLREKDAPPEREGRMIIDDGDEAPPSDAPDGVVLPVIRVAIIGRPNVGKSTLLNTIIGEQRAIVSDISGTTRDAIEVPLTREAQEYLLTDTAGLRKQGRVADSVEHFSVMRALRALADCDVAVVVLDGTEGPTAQDARIVGLAHEEGRGVVIAVNKWDAVKKDHRTVQEFKMRIRETFKFAPYAPIIFISAKTGRRCPWVLQTAREVALERMKRIPTGELNRVLAHAIKRSPLPMYRGRPLKLYFGAQVDVAPPRFILFFNHPKAVHFSNLRHIKNELRDRFGFEGSDIKLMTKKRVPSEKQL